ncbi:MAG: DUF86 domain-containing protein [Chitinophagaceae bacterium]|nr:DUF86 domain-containing protein [Chitinophagaceae bacterium]
MRGKLGDKVRLLHILDAIQEIEVYFQDVEYTSFLSNSMLRFACIKQMEIIGEASNHISDEIKNKFTSIQWAQIIGMRNVFVQEYFGIDSTLVWDIIKNDLPELKSNIQLVYDSLHE